jgi:hypothetical protein
MRGRAETEVICYKTSSFLSDSMDFTLMFSRITTVLTKLAAAKVTLEKVGLLSLFLGLSLSYSIHYSMI